jgi:hypothetical protein
MSEYKRHLIDLGWRLLIAAPFFYVGISGCLFVVSPFFNYLGALIIAHPIASLLAEPFGNIYYPKKYREKAPPTYSIARSKRAFADYEAALAEFYKIVGDYPDEMNAWIEMIQIAAYNLHDHNSAEIIFHKAIYSLTKEEDRNTLKAIYQNITSQKEMLDSE